MTDNTVDLDAKRKSKVAKGPRCQMCGEPVHEVPGLCRRLDSLEHILEDGTAVRYYLRPLPEDDEPEPDVAG
jgi:hypothetical protein